MALSNLLQKSYLDIVLDCATDDLASDNAYIIRGLPPVATSAMS